MAKKNKNDQKTVYKIQHRKLNWVTRIQRPRAF